MELSTCLCGACYMSEEDLGEVLKAKGRHLSLKNSLSGAVFVNSDCLNFFFLYRFTCQFLAQFETI